MFYRRPFHRPYSEALIERESSNIVKNLARHLPLGAGKTQDGSRGSKADLARARRPPNSPTAGSSPQLLLSKPPSTTKLIRAGPKSGWRKMRLKIVTSLCLQPPPPPSRLCKRTEFGKYIFTGGRFSFICNSLLLNCLPGFPVVLVGSTV